MRTLFLSLTVALVTTATFAQNSSQVALDNAQMGAEGARDQRIERIAYEDKATRIEELREGGQTRRITVQPKGEGMPTYEVEPAQRQYGSGAGGSQDGTNGRRTWRAFEF